MDGPDTADKQQLMTVDDGIPAMLESCRLIGSRVMRTLLGGISRSTFQTKMASGKILAPLPRSGKSHQWMVGEVREWILEGMPDGLSWEAMKKRNKKTFSGGFNHGNS